MIKSNNILNSIHEVGIRILIQLYLLNGKEKSSDYISSLDYLSLYSKTFNIGDNDLNGQNPYRLGEFASRLNVGKQSLKFLVSLGLCSVIHVNKGFRYVITDSGIKVVENLSNDYAELYKQIAKNTQSVFSDYSDVDIIKYISMISNKKES